jgi:RNA ligase (TIGR02306 family)
MGNEIVRKLATIRRVANLSPIVFLNKETGQNETAGVIELATVDGWKVVVKKGEFKIGDLGVYFEIDSILPFRTWSEFLRDKNRPERAIRLKTVRLKGQMSQGLLLPLSAFSEADLTWFSEGEDVTELLEVKKYEPDIPAALQGLARGNFPSFIHKTDQERIQNDVRILELDLDYEITEKLEGSSCTIYFKSADIGKAEGDTWCRDDFLLWREKSFGVCSRNLNLKESDNTFWTLARKYNLRERMSFLNRDLAIQGEVVGPGIQDNIYKLTEPELYVFDVFDIPSGEYLPAEERYKIVKQLGLKHVPIIAKARISSELNNLEGVLQLAEGTTHLFFPEKSDIQREGLVFKSLDGKISWKAISNAYLLKGKN